SLQDFFLLWKVSFGVNMAFVYGRLIAYSFLFSLLSDNLVPIMLSIMAKIRSQIPMASTCNRSVSAFSIADEAEAATLLAASDNELAKLDNCVFCSSLNSRLEKFFI